MATGGCAVNVGSTSLLVPFGPRGPSRGRHAAETLRTKRHSHSSSRVLSSHVRSGIIPPSPPRTRCGAQRPRPRPPFGRNAGKARDGRSLHGSLELREARTLRGGRRAQWCVGDARRRRHIRWPGPDEKRGAEGADQASYPGCKLVRHLFNGRVGTHAEDVGLTHQILGRVEHRVEAFRQLVGILRPDWGHKSMPRPRRAMLGAPCPPRVLWPAPRLLWRRAP